MLCCSSVCERAAECNRHVYNDRSEELQQIENLDSFGSASISADGIVENYWCGEKGDWRMFEPIEPDNFVLHTNGDKEPIEYIAEQDDLRIRVFAKSGEYMAYRKGHCVWKHSVHYEASPSISGDYEVEDWSRWFVADDVVNIVVVDDKTE